MSTVIYHDCNSDDGGDWRLNTPSGLAACFSSNPALDTSNKQCGAGSLKGATDLRLRWRNTDGDSFFSGGNSDIGALSFWYRQTGAARGHSNYPVLGLRSSTACQTDTNKNQISLFWSASAFNRFGTLIRDKDGVEQLSENYAWTPTANTWYHVELNWDGVAGETRLFIAGSSVWENLTDTFDRDDTTWPCNLLQHRPSQSGSETRWIDEVYVFDEVQHTANFTPPSCPVFLDSWWPEMEQPSPEKVEFVDYQI